MENAIWKGKQYVAINIAKNYELEKQILEARGNKELRCPDPDCPTPMITYCHPRNWNGDWNSLGQHERLPEFPVITGGKPHTLSHSLKNTHEIRPS